MVYDDGVEVGRVSLLYVGTDWMWLVPEMEVVLPGDTTMKFTRSYSNVTRGQCVEVMTAMLDRSRFEELAEDGFAMEAPKLGIVRVPAYYFGGLVTAFDDAKEAHGVAPSTSETTTR
jgi:hypothetical protein